MKNMNTSETYSPSSYETPQRLASFYYQIDCVRSELEKADVAINIGKGSGYIKWYILGRTFLKGKLYDVDIDHKIRPDVLSSVTSLGLSDSVADVVFCCQVLEHLPYNEFSTSLSELYRIAKPSGKVVLSLPNGDFHIAVSLKLPKLRVKRLIKIPFLTVRHSPLDKKHFWEVNRKGFSLKKVKKVIENFFIIEKVFRPLENPYHQFFVLKPKEEISRNGK